MGRRIGLLFALGSVAGVVLAAPSGGFAATTVGQTFQPTVDNSCFGNDWEVMQTGRASGPSYAAPSAGVLTSWSFAAGDQETTITLRVFHPTGTSHQYQVLADGGLLQTVPASSGLRTFPTQITVQAGNLIGIHSRTGNCAAETLNTADTFDLKSGMNTPVGGIANYTPGSGFILDIAARLEPDADNDTFGDETQDQCLGQAGSFNGCVPTPAAAPAAGPTGQRAAALKKCKKKHSKKARKKCRKKAKKLPV